MSLFDSTWNWISWTFWFPCHRPAKYGRRWSSALDQTGFSHSYQLIRTYKFDAAEVIEYIAICRLYISLVISDPITELSWKLDSVANFVCKIVHLYISSIMHAILSTGTLQEDIFLHWDLIVIVSDWNFKKHDRFLVYIQTQCLRNNHCLRHQILTAICLVWLSVLSQSWWEFFTRLLHMTSNNEKISQMCRSTHARSI